MTSSLADVEALYNSADSIAATEESHKRATETAERHAARVKELTDRYGRYADTVQKAAQRNRALSESLKDGTFSRHASDLAKINREYATLQQRAKLTELVAQHGQLGAVARSNAAQLALIGRTAGLAVGGVLALGTGLARAGLAGTVEGYRLEYAWMRLSRQVAAVAIPAVNLLSKTIGRAADWFSKLNGDQQDTILKMGLVTAGTLALGGALRTLVTVGGAAVAVLRTIGAVSGMTAASSAIAGSTLATAPVAAAGVAGTAGAVATGAAGTGAGVATAASRTGLIARAAPLLGRLGIGIGTAVGTIEAGRGLLREHEAGGIAGVGRGLGRGFARAADLPFSLMTGPLGQLIPGLDRGPFTRLYDRFLGAEGSPMGTGSSGPAGAAQAHRDVSVNQASLLEAGQSHFNIQESLLKVMAAKEEEEKEKIEVQKQLKESMDKLADEMRKQTDRLQQNGVGGAFGGQGSALSDSYSNYMRMIGDRIAQYGR